MTTFLFFLHISAALLIGKNAYHRGRSPIIWTLLTLIPYAIFVTWPLLYILPRCNTQIAQTPLALATPLLVDLRSASKPPTNNKSFYVGVTVWIVCLIVVGMTIMVRL